MAPHSSTLAWKIPWTEEPGTLQSMGSQRVRHDWATSLSLFTFMHWRRKWQPTPVFLPGESQGQGILVGCCLCGCAELDMTSDLAAADHQGLQSRSDMTLTLSHLKANVFQGGKNCTDTKFIIRDSVRCERAHREAVCFFEVRSKAEIHTRRERVWVFFLMMRNSVKRWFKSLIWASVVKNPSAKQEMQVWSLGQEDPLEGKWQRTPVFLPGKSHGQRSLVGYSPWGPTQKSWTWLSGWAQSTKSLI